MFNLFYFFFSSCSHFSPYLIYFSRMPFKLLIFMKLALKNLDLLLKRNVCVWNLIFLFKVDLYLGCQITNLTLEFFVHGNEVFAFLILSFESFTLPIDEFYIFRKFILQTLDFMIFFILFFVLYGQLSNFLLIICCILFYLSFEFSFYCCNH